MDFPKVTLRQNWTWNISSGIRTLFMLPSISETTSHTRLRHECGVRSYVPDTIFGHHEIFKDIVHNSNANWHTEILFFTKKWLEPCENNSGWVKLQEYWTKEAWWQFQYWANRVVLNLNWEEFIAELSHRKIKLASYLLDTIKQLISIATGTITGFRVCDNSETIAPTNIIEDAYLNIYSLRKYAPLIMHPDMLLPNNTFSRVYYSLQYPTLPEKPTDLKNFPSVMKMMRQLKSLMDIFLNIMEKYKPITEKNLLDFNNCVDFSYFHSECDKFNIAKPTKVLFQEDQLLKDALKKFKQKTVPENSHFLRGCVRISLEKN